MTAKIPSFFTDPAVHAAAHEYIARKNRARNPAGEFDKAGRWYPAAHERRECCSSIRAPSLAWPYSKLTHCRSVEHVAALYETDASDVRKLAHRIEQIRASKVDMLLRALSRSRLISLLDSVIANAADSDLRYIAIDMRVSLAEEVLNRIAKTDRVSRETEIAAAGEVVL